MASTVAAGGLTILGARRARGQARKVFKAGLIGCGGRGVGAARNCVNAGKHHGVEVRITALADAYPDRVNGARSAVKRLGQEVPKERCFAGVDAYKRLVATDVDIVLMATPPNFRPPHFEAAVEAGKHTFIEKPVAVDPVGCRRMLAAGERATKKRLSVVSGLCLRHEKNYRGMKMLVADGAIGRILGGTIYYCTGSLGRTPRRKGWSDAEYLIRNWKNFVELSGDHIVEQHVHTIDTLNWLMGATPLATVAVGGRARRVTGNQYDFFSAALEYPKEVHVHSICRQINGCWRWGNGIHVVGEKGWADIRRGVWLWGAKEKLPMPKLSLHRSMYVQEHIVLLDSILKGEPINDTKDVTDATLTAIMARIAAYTGQRVEWRQLTDPEAKSKLYNLALKPTAEDFETGNVKAPQDDVVPIPGRGR